MHGVFRYVAALAILVLIGATVATVDAAPGKSISAFVTGNARGNDDDKDQGGSANGNGQPEDPGGGQGNAGVNGNAGGNGNGAAVAGDDESNPADNGNAGDEHQDQHANDQRAEHSNKQGNAPDDDEDDGESDDDAGGADDNPGATPVGDHKVTVCHHTSSQSNPIVVIAVDEHAVPAHEQHGDEVVDDAGDCFPQVGTPEPTETPASPIASPTEEPTETPATPIASPTGSPVGSPTETP